MNREFCVKICIMIKIQGIVRTVITTTKEGLPLVKKFDNGTFGRYDLCSVELTEGGSKGQVVWATRTIDNKAGEIKVAVESGQEVTLIGSVVDGKPFFNISTGPPPASDADILANYFGIVATGIAPTATAPVATSPF